MRAGPIIGSMFLATAGPSMAAGQSDEARIRALEQQQATAWNAHDIASYAALFTPEADVINVLGWRWHGRAELQQKLGTAFRSVFARSQLTIGEVSVEFVTCDVAVAHVRWTMTRALSPTGAGGNAPEQGIQTQVLVRRNGQWKIRDFQNTNSIPEAPFPPTR